MKKKVSAASIVYAVVIFALFAYKFSLFYPHLHLAEFDLPMVFASLGMTALLYCLISTVSPKAAKITIASIYVFTSVLLAVDAVHYAYLSRLTSVVKLGVAGQLLDVLDTVKNLIKTRHILMIADLPLWVLYLANKWTFKSIMSRSKISGAYVKYTENRLPGWIHSAVSGGIAVLCILVMLLFPGFKPEYIENELYYYHGKDIVVNWILPKEDYAVDKDKYAPQKPPAVTEPADTEDSVPTDTDGSADITDTTDTAKPEPDLEEIYGRFYGVAEGKNVIVIQVEALQNFVINQFYNGQELTPNLNSLIGEDSFYFSHYYYQIGGGNTADAEFTVNNSLFAPENVAAYNTYLDKDFYSLPYILKDNGYTGSHAYHGYVGTFWNREAAYVNQGFDSFTSLEDFEQNEMIGMGLSDRQLYIQSMEQLKEFEEPFHAFLITLSSHHPYGIPLADRQIQLTPEDEGSLFGLYLQSINYTDRMIGEFIEMLKAEGLYENSIIVIYGDHYALSNSDPVQAPKVSAMLGHQYDLFEMFSVPLIINIPGMEHTETIDIAGGHIDVLPTLLHLLGIQNDKAIMFGQNLITAESGFVCELEHLSVGSFISDEIFFQKPHNNIESNYSVYKYGTMERLNFRDYIDLSEYAAQRIRDCNALIEANDVLLD